ncbi:MAG: hypothetical protein RL354_1246 [Planctomycetota bacterium]
MQPDILLTLSAGSVRPLLAAKDPRCPTIFAVPQFVATDLELRGLNLPTDMLKGFGLAEIEKLRDEADRAHCPVLLLTEEAPIDFVHRTGPTWVAALDRLRRLGTAANRLGCPSIAVRILAVDTDEAFEATAIGVKVALKELDKFELNLLIAPSEGLTFDAGRLTDLIKKIGGFRIGSYPSFAHAHATGDLEKTLRKLAPYAPAIAASVRGFDAEGKHDGFSLAECIESVRSVGYGNTLALDFVGRDAAGGAGGKAGGKAESDGKKKGSKVSAKDAASAVDIVAELDMARRQLIELTAEPELSDVFDDDEE